MRITQKLISELVKKENRLKVLFMYNINQKFYVTLSTKTKIMDVKICLN